MLGILTFIIIFGILVVVHEFGHFYFAKKSGILVREFAIGMGPKIFSHMDSQGTLYTIRILPLGGYVRMAGWGDDKTEIKTGTPASLSLNDEHIVTRINLSSKQIDNTSLPIYVTSHDLEDKLTITGLVFDETKTYKVDHDATIVEEDGTEIRIAPLDVQYQNASVWGRMITNFAGPMNNFILGIIVFTILVFMQGGSPNEQTNAVRVVENSPAQKAGIKTNDRILSVGNNTVSNWQDLTQAVEKATQKLDSKHKTIRVSVKSKNTTKKLTLKPEKSQSSYIIGVRPALKTGLVDKLVGGLKLSIYGALAILVALKNLVFNFSLNKLGGPVAMYKMSSDAAKQGIISVLSLMGMLSMNLGIFNLIPIPALDGGKILMNIIEAIRRKPMKQETETYITLAGVAIMVVLMIAVTWNDIMRTFF
ncbi:RIP metalloprotease RseP [Streptococcus urinalis FB127-CNA-2]|uniref:Zinc metalloprotease n=1 Tax=Streptococcus urinalis 2285-97 TaxID=764291 RepID=G5KDR8_9STRE|nr:RIP metalloprotease RseP [Streptococcus urinalis]EHJ56329.1 RIP metalloprotease RseP [Streptococcus urinalis 2285-97]EKS17400.1 RIP metalloprotease RseP [Streptococcus urinalis FB127-CNA-2]VEF32777.1 Intramembrane protease RasP/YluC, implicated in cell division based on FtsL cleavage [Streptococcus urinalis]